MTISPVSGALFVIELCGTAYDWVRNAKHIVVIGHSFNNAGEHFNDILRNYPDRKIVVGKLDNPMADLKVIGSA